MAGRLIDRIPQAVQVFERTAMRTALRRVGGCIEVSFPICPSNGSGCLNGQAAIDYVRLALLDANGCPCGLSTVSPAQNLTRRLPGATLTPLAWCSSDNSLESPRKVALICEPGFCSHYGKALSFHHQ